MDLIDACEALGIVVGADATAARSAYRRLLSYWHPDRNSSTEATDKTQLFIKAFEALEAAGFPARQSISARSAVLTQATGRSVTDFRGDANPDDGNGFRNYYRAWRENHEHGPKPVLRGRTINRTLKLTLEEAAHGCTREVVGRVVDNCETCAGRGWLTEMTCAMCEGGGRFSAVGAGRGATLWCSKCGGSGLVREACGGCLATGHRRDPRTYRLATRVPPGVMHGDHLVLRGLGGRGAAGATAGDIELRIEIERHEVFSFDNENYLCCTVPVTLLQQLCCEVVRIPTLWGEESIRLDPSLSESELPLAGFPGRSGERFALRVKWQVLRQDFSEAQLKVLRDTTHQLVGMGLPRPIELTHWEGNLARWRQRLKS